MPLKTDRSDLPRQVDGVAPDPEPRYVTALAQAWHDQYLADGNDERATANGSLLRGSDAGSCARQLAYKLRGRKGEDVAPSDPLTVADSWRFFLGQVVHEALEAPLKAAFPDAEVEVVGVYETPDLSLHADALIVENGRRVLLELKTLGGWGFKSAVGAQRGTAEGPRLSAILQGALAAKALDCDEMVVGVLSLELLSPSVAAKAGFSEVGRFAASWTWRREEFEPMADAEAARLGKVLELVEERRDVPRSIPGITPKGARVVDPAAGRWELRSPENDMILDSGSAWMCSYCNFQSLCDQDCREGR